MLLSIAIGWVENIARKQQTKVKIVVIIIIIINNQTYKESS